MTDTPPSRDGEDRVSEQGQKLELAMNIGPVTAGWLREVGIHTLDELEEIGSIEAWRRIKERYPGAVSLVGLYALEGALLGVRWNNLPPDIKAQLRGAARV